MAASSPASATSEYARDTSEFRGSSPPFTPIMGSLTAIVAYRRPARVKQRALPAYVSPEQRSTPMLVLGERHFETTNGRAPQPSWLTIPQRASASQTSRVGYSLRTGPAEPAKTKLEPEARAKSGWVSGTEFATGW